MRSCVWTPSVCALQRPRATNETISKTRKQPAQCSLKIQSVAQRSFFTRFLSHGPRHHQGRICCVASSASPKRARVASAKRAGGQNSTRSFQETACAQADGFPGHIHASCQGDVSALRGLVLAAATPAAHCSDGECSMVQAWQRPCLPLCPPAGSGACLSLAAGTQAGSCLLLAQYQEATCSMSA